MADILVQFRMLGYCQADIYTETIFNFLSIYPTVYLQSYLRLQDF